MKKILILLILLVLMPIGINVFAIPTLTYYELTFVNGYKYDHNGKYVATPNWASTHKEFVLDDFIIVDNVNYYFIEMHFWNKNNQYIGYVSTEESNYTDSHFIEQNTDLEIPVPAGARLFAITTPLFEAYTTTLPEFPSKYHVAIFGSTALGEIDIADRIPTNLIIAGEYGLPPDPTHLYYQQIRTTTKVYSDASYGSTSTALNNHTLREVFEGGNLVPNYDMETTSGWSSYGGTISSLNGIITINTISTQAIVQLYRSIDYTVPINTKLYARNRMKTDTVITNFSLRLENVVTGSSQYTTISNPIINEWYEISNIYTTTVNGKPLINSNFNIGGLFSGLLLDVDYYYLIDLNSFGIEDLTVAQMDSWFTIFNGSYTEYLYDITDLDNNYTYYSPIYDLNFSFMTPEEVLATIDAQIDNNWKYWVASQYLEQPLSVIVPLFDTWENYYIPLKNYYRYASGNEAPTFTVFDNTLLYSLVEIAEPDTRTILDKIEDYLGEVGGDSPFIKTLISIVIIILIVVLLSLLHAPSSIILISGIMVFLLFALFGWIPVWLTMVLGMLSFVLAWLQLKSLASGSGGDSE